MSDELSPFLFEHEDQAGRIYNRLIGGGSAGLALLKEHAPDHAALQGAGPKLSLVTMDDAELIYAKMRGFVDWAAFRIHVHRLNDHDAPEAFLRAERSILGRNSDLLKALLIDHPQLVSDAPPENYESLLMTAVSYREPEFVRILLDAGADIEHVEPGGFRPLHRAAYGHPPEPNPGPQSAHAEILDLLIERGADLGAEAYGSGGTPLAMALFWGHSVLAQKLAAAGVTPGNLKVGAGLGEFRILDHMIIDGDMNPHAKYGLQFYRPHEGFPEWKRTYDDQEVLDEAFICAAVNGQFAAMEWLLERGADINGKPWTETALSWTAYKGPEAVVAWLLERGADVNRRQDRPRGATPLHAAATAGRLTTIRILLDAGADPSAVDEDYNSTPAGYAAWAGHEEIAEMLAAAE